MSLDHDQVVQALPAYQIEGEIGRGGWGVVLSATHRELGRRVAIKQLPRAFGADPAVRTRFKEEARLVASLTHPHIVPVFDFVEHDGLCLIVMELLTGGTLWDRFLDEGVPLDDACALLLAASAALQHAHSHGILHRDIKPENFLFSDTGTMKLGDFGIAKVIGSAAVQLTVAGSVMGTPAYMAPEQALGQKLGPGTDIYSLGVMLYELASGDLPFPETDDPLHQLIAKTDGDPRPLVELRPDIHPELNGVIMQAIARRPEDRQASAADLGLSLARAATVAFGPGWLRQCGVEVMSAPQMIALTEQSTGSSTPVMHPGRLTRATSVHPRIGDLLLGIDTEPMAAPGPATDPDLPAVIRRSSGATLAPDWTGGTTPPTAPTPPTPPSPTGETPAVAAGPTDPPPWAPPAVTPPAAPPAAAYDPTAGLPYDASAADAYAAPAYEAPAPTAAVPTSDLSPPVAPYQPVTGPPPGPTYPTSPSYEPVAPLAPTYEAAPPTPTAPPAPPAYPTPTTYEPTPAHDPTPATYDPTPAAYDPAAYAAPAAYEAPPAAYQPAAYVAPPPAPAYAPPASGPPQPPGPAHPPVPPGPTGPPTTSGASRGRVVLVVIVVLIVLAVLGVGGVLLTRGTSGTATPPASTASTATDTSSTAPADSTTTAAVTTTKVVPPGPEITDFTQVSPGQVSISWRDTADPTAAHVLVAYSATGKEQNPMTGSPQEVNFAAGSGYCFEITAIGSTIRRSEAKCVNGADPTQLVKHDDNPLKVTTTTAKP